MHLSSTWLFNNAPMQNAVAPNLDVVGAAVSNLGVTMGLQGLSECPVPGNVIVAMQV
jgi:hypothetical protein